MSYEPPSGLLRGTPLWKAECYGKPHFSCRYRLAMPARGPAARAVNATAIDDGARCMCCGRPATNAHHWPPKGTCPTFSLHGERLRPALFALCGSGTTGCHGGWHGGARYRALWRWDGDEAAREWWEGGLLDDVGPHDQALYGFGCWEVDDLRDGRIWQVRL